MSTQEIGALIESVNEMTGTVAGKMGDIDNKLNQKMAEVDNTLDNLFLDARFGIQPTYEVMTPQTIDGANASDSVVVPVFTFDVEDQNAFYSGSFIVDIFATGATSGVYNWFRQLHVSYKQQQTTFTYNVKCTGQNGGATGVVSLTYDPNGGQFNSGQLKIWLNSIAGYNVMTMVARGSVRRYDASQNAFYNDRGSLHFRNQEGFLANSAQHDAVKALPNFTELDV
ncbi:TPA: hypothetical protein ACMDTC_004293 [Vibrio parahaemolyticus]